MHHSMAFNVLKEKKKKLSMLFKVLVLKMKLLKIIDIINVEIGST